MTEDTAKWVTTTMTKESHQLGPQVGRVSIYLGTRLKVTRKSQQTLGIAGCWDSAHHQGNVSHLCCHWKAQEKAPQASSLQVIATEDPVFLIRSPQGQQALGALWSTGQSFASGQGLKTLPGV